MPDERIEIPVVMQQIVPALDASGGDHRIEEFGLERVREPHVKHVRGSLREMRMKGRDGISRALYVTAVGRRVVVVRVFVKKTQKTPDREIELALERARGWSGPSLHLSSGHSEVRVPEPDEARIQHGHECAP